MAAEQKQEQVPDHVNLPAPTAWPFVTALWTYTARGGAGHTSRDQCGRSDSGRARRGRVVSRRVAGGTARVGARAPAGTTGPPDRACFARSLQFQPGVAGHRVRIPAEIHPYSSGIKGGILGGIAMAIVACVYGVIAHRSIWYPINLLAAAAVPSLAQADLAQLTAFNGTGFIVGLISHGVFSILVGLLFAVLLPMLPSRRAAFWGSLISPLLWSALIWATLRLINPALNARIDWIWFIASQIAFGMTTGYVVHHSKMVETMQTWPLAARAGIEAPGVMSERGEKR